MNEARRNTTSRFHHSINNDLLGPPPVLLAPSPPPPYAESDPLLHQPPATSTPRRQPRLHPQRDHEDIDNTVTDTTAAIVPPTHGLVGNAGGVCTEELVYAKLCSILNRPSHKFEDCCDFCSECFCCVDGGSQAEDIAEYRAYNVGWRGILHTMFSNNPSKVCVAWKCFFHIVCFLLALVSTAMGVVTLSLQLKSEVMIAQIIFTAGSAALLLYTLIDLIIYIRFMCNRERFASQLKLGVGKTSSYLPNVFRLIVPELLVYPMFTSSVACILNKQSKFSLTNVIVAGLLLIIMVYFQRLYFFIRSSYMIVQAQFLGMQGAAKGHTFWFFSFFIFESIMLTASQILLICFASLHLTPKEDFQFDWLVWVAFGYGYVSYTFGMVSFVLINFKMLRGFCVEFFHNICKKIIQTNPALKTKDQLTSHTLNEVERRPLKYYPNCNQSCCYSFKTPGILLTNLMMSSVGLGAVGMLVYMILSPGTEVTELSVIISAIVTICLANFQGFLIITVIVMVLIAVLVVLALGAILILLMLRFGGRRY